MEINSSFILLLFGVVIATLLLFHPNGEPFHKLFGQIRSTLENSDMPRSSSHSPLESLHNTQSEDIVKLDSIVETSIDNDGNTIAESVPFSPSEDVTGNEILKSGDIVDVSPLNSLGTNIDRSLVQTNDTIEQPKIYPFPLTINDQDFTVDLTDVDIVSVESSVRNFCLVNSERLNISASSLDEGCFKPISRHVLFETRELRAKLSGVPVPSKEIEISIPLTNYKGEDEDFRITFNPALNTVEDIAFALCNQQKVWFGLSTTEDIDTICVGPVSKLISSYFAENQSQNLLNSSGDSLTSAPLEEGMIEVGVPIKNYAGNENVYIVTFNPSVSSPRDAASALCNQNKAEFGLIADEFVESNCIVPVTAYIVDNMNQSFNGNNSPTAQDSVVEREVTVAAVASSSSSSELA